MESAGNSRHPDWAERAAWSGPARAALAADRTGDLFDASRIITAWNRSLPTHGTPDDLATSFRLKAKIFRHRYDAASLEVALDAAEQSVRVVSLLQLPQSGLLRPLASLELLACEITAGVADDVEAALSTWLRHELVPVSGWAWVLNGQDQLRVGDPLRAAACLQNAVAEFDRSGHYFRARTARIALADALDQAGRVNDARRILEADRDQWTTGSPEIRRTAIGYRLVSAANHLGRGTVAAALADLNAADLELSMCSGLDHRWAELETLRADCLREWRQVSEAEAALQRAREHTSQVYEAPAVRHAPPVPALPEPVQLGRSDFVASAVGGGRLDPLAIPREASATQMRIDVDAVLDGAENFYVADLAGIDAVVTAVESIGGTPGLERYEIVALFRAAELMRDARGRARDAGLLSSERLFRRCLVRAGMLPHTETLRARAQIGLARVLAMLGDRDDEAFTLVMQGLRAIDAERFHMLRRDYRNNWLQTEVHPAYELAIRLAVERDQQLAADLIVFSRTPGIVMVSDDDAQPMELPLMPMPQVIHIDGTRSQLGSHGVCRFR